MFVKQYVKQQTTELSANVKLVLVHQALINTGLQEDQSWNLTEQTQGSNFKSLSSISTCCYFSNTASRKPAMLLIAIVNVPENKQSQVQA